MLAIQTSKPDFAAIQKLTNKVLKSNFIFYPPVIAAELADAYGLEVWEITFKPEYVRVAGFIDFPNKRILVNEEDSLIRKNYTIAHELGHYLLRHHEQEGGYTVLLRNPDEMVQTLFEQEADCFATNVLVPKTFLQKYLKDHPKVTNSQLAVIFGVSAEIIRRQRLHL